MIYKRKRKNPHKKRKWNRINMHHFENVDINVVDELPVKIYKKQVQWISGGMKQKMADDGKFQIQVGLC